jgi:hypothetical protein
VANVGFKGFPPPPINDPFIGKDGQPTPSWVSWFQTVSTNLIAQARDIIASAIQPFTQSALPTNLTANEKGFLVEVSDFGHTLRWNGSGWGWGPGDSGSGYISGFLETPTASGWALCDGSTVKRLNSDGTLTSVTLPDYTTASYLKLGITANVGPNAPSGSTAAITAGTPAGTNSAPTFTGTPGTTSVESADTANVAVTGATSVAAANHTHTLTPAGIVSAPAFTGNPMATHSHGAGTLDLQNTQLQAYYRQ